MVKQEQNPNWNLMTKANCITIRGENGAKTWLSIVLWFALVT